MFRAAVTFWSVVEDNHLFYEHACLLIVQISRTLHHTRKNNAAQEKTSTTGKVCG